MPKRVKHAAALKRDPGGPYARGFKARKGSGGAVLARP